MRDDPHQDIDDPRRAFLIRALAAGIYAGGLGVSASVSANFLGQRPEKLEPGRSFYRIVGSVLVNGHAANLNTPVSANDVIETGAGSLAVFVVGEDAFLLRQNSRLELRSASTGPVQAGGTTIQVVDFFNLLTGAVLTVFGKNTHRAATSTAHIGIRGTGVYFESEPERSYVCTCYGSTEIVSQNDPASRVEVVSRHHDAPKYVLREGRAGQRIIPAPFKNHSDLELMLLEELVGRTPPFLISSDSYGAPRRGGY
jgi:hypothetical protein